MTGAVSVRAKLLTNGAAFCAVLAVISVPDRDDDGEVPDRDFNYDFVLPKITYELLFAVFSVQVPPQTPPSRVCLYVCARVNAHLYCDGAYLSNPMAATTWRGADRQRGLHVVDPQGMRAGPPSYGALRMKVFPMSSRHTNPHMRGARHWAGARGDLATLGPPTPAHPSPLALKRPGQNGLVKRAW